MQPLSLVERRSRVEAAREALTGITQVLYQCSGPELAEVLGVVDAVVAQGVAARVAITAEALGRGEVEAAGVNATAWVRDHAPSLRQGGAADVATIAGLLAPADARWGGESGGPDADSPEGIVADAVVSAVVSPGLGCAAVREMTERLPASADGRRRVAYYANGYHMLLRDLQRETVWRDILTWMSDPDGPLPSGAEEQAAR